MALESEPAGTRTQGPYIKSVLLYQLSYEFFPLRFHGSSKIGSFVIQAKLICFYFLLWVVGYELWVEGWGLWVVGYGLWVMIYAF